MYEGDVPGELLCTIDPGGSTTGWSVWELPAASPIVRIDYGLVKGGLRGFIEWALDHHRYLRETTVACEKFVPEGGPIDYTPLQIEGALEATLTYLAAPPPIYQLRSRKRNLGTSKARGELLRRAGFWISDTEARTDPAILHEDARDVNDAALHALIYAKDFEHNPTLRALWAP